MEPSEVPWPHAPTHQLSVRGTYMVTAATYLKAHHFRDPKRLDVLQLQGIGEAIQALREDLQAAVANAGLDAAILKWATK